MDQCKLTNGMFERLPTLEEINARLVENVREKRLLAQLKKLAEQRVRLEDARRQHSTN